MGDKKWKKWKNMLTLTRLYLFILPKNDFSAALYQWHLISKILNFPHGFEPTTSGMSGERATDYTTELPSFSIE